MKNNQPKSKFRLTAIESWWFALTACCAAFLCFMPSAKGDAISFTLTNSSVIISSDGTVSFQGSVTNNSGQDLSASDFFFNFSNYGASVTPNQDLGISDFAIPNGATSAVVDLFDLSIVGSAPGSVFPIDVQLEDIANDTSALETATVTVAGTVAVPEPESLLLLATGGVGIALRRRLTRTNRVAT